MKREDISNIVLPQVKNYFVSIIGSESLDSQTNESKINFFFKTEGVKEGDQEIESQNYVTLELAEKPANTKIFNIASKAITLNVFERQGELFDFILANTCEDGDIDSPLPIENIASKGLIKKGEKVKIKTDLILPGIYIKVPCEPYTMTEVDETTRLIKVRNQITRDPQTGGYTVKPAILDWFGLFILEGEMEDAHNLIWAEYKRRVQPYLLIPTVEEEE
jgi:hypothetical protein